MLSVAMSKMSIVLCRSWSESQWTIFWGYLTISINTRCHQICSRWWFLCLSEL